MLVKPSLDESVELVSSSTANPLRETHRHRSRQLLAGRVGVAGPRNGLRHSFRHGSEGGFDARRCAVEMLPEKAANAVIVLEILTKMILSALAEKIAEGGQDALLAEHANLDDLLIVQRLLGHASSTMRSVSALHPADEPAGCEGDCGVKRPEQDLRRQREPSGRTAGGLMPGRGERRSR